MPIQVQCPSCHAEFKVSEKFAGKKGPCPKCKATIQVPALEDEVKVHAPDSVEGASAAAQARLAVKPIPRQDTAFKPTRVALILIGVAGAFAAAGLGTGLWQNLVLRALALVLISLPICIAGYALLREEELEPYRGTELWFRAGICTAVYSLLWGGYYLIPEVITEMVYSWIFIAPVFFLVGATAAYFCFDVEFGSGFFHYAMYVLLTMALGWTAGLTMPWHGPPPPVGPPPMPFPTQTTLEQTMSLVQLLTIG